MIDNFTGAVEDACYAGALKELATQQPLGGLLKLLGFSFKRGYCWCLTNLSCVKL